MPFTIQYPDDSISNRRCATLAEAERVAYGWPDWRIIELDDQDNVIMPSPQGNLFPEAPLPPIGEDKILDDDERCECENCGEEFDTEDGYELDGERFCPDCIYRCEECEKQFVGNDELHLVKQRVYRNGRHHNDEKFLCEECCTKCADCDEWFAKDTGGVNESDEPICEHCQENYYSCEDCNSCVHSDNVRCVDDGTYCESCYRNHREEEEEKLEHIHAHSHKPRAVFHNAGNTFGCELNTLYFGVEVEVEGGVDDNVAKKVTSDLLYCKQDGSLNDGFEVISHPATLDYWRDWKGEPFKYLRKQGYTSYDTLTCGMHVHVSRDRISEGEIVKLMKFMRDNQNFVWYISRRHSIKRLCDYSAPTSERLTHLMRKAKRKFIRDGDGDYHCGGSRYAAINTQNEHTVEFRIFRGTLVLSSFRRNLELVHSLIEFAQCHRLREMTATAFITFVMNSTCEHKKALAVWLQKYDMHNVYIPEGEESESLCA